MTNHHLYNNYCDLYKRLCKEANLVPSDCRSMSDRVLLMRIDVLLKSFGCIPMTEEELDVELI